MAMHLLERDQAGARRLAEAVLKALQSIRHCSQCRNFSDTEVCDICSRPSRDQSTVCVVESPADVIAIESSAAYQGRYFVLLGRLSPLDGYGPEQLGLDEIEEQLKKGQIKEIILATSATVEGDITAQYVADIALKFGVASSRLARGIPSGGELEYIDSATLSRALAGRQKFD